MLHFIYGALPESISIRYNYMKYYPRHPETGRDYVLVPYYELGNFLGLVEKNATNSLRPSNELLGIIDHKLSRHRRDWDLPSYNRIGVSVDRSGDRFQTPLIMHTIYYCQVQYNSTFFQRRLSDTVQGFSRTGYAGIDL